MAELLIALINEMNSAGLINRNEIVAGILEESKPQPAASQAQVVVELPAPPLPKPDLDDSMAVITDPMKLKIPREQFHGEASNTWLV